MNPRLPFWLRVLNWTAAFLALLWIAYDRALQPWLGTPLVTPTAGLYSWLRDLAAIAMAIGLLHLLFVHLRRVWSALPDWGYSLCLLAAAMTVATMGLIDNGIHGQTLLKVYAHLLAPGEAALAASALFVLAGSVWAALRLRRRGARWLLLGMLSTLVLQMPWVNGMLPSEFTPYLEQATQLIVGPVMRGLLIGTGLVLFAAVIGYVAGPAARSASRG